MHIQPFPGSFSHLATLLLAAAVFACGGGPLTDHEGIYLVTHHTKNPTSCGGEGDSLLIGGDARYFYIANQSFFGVELVAAGLCSDLAECEANLADESFSLFGWTFGDGSDAAGWSTEMYGGQIEDNQCTNGTFTVIRLTFPVAEAARVEARSYPTDEFAADSDGFCEAGSEHVQTAGCFNFEVVEATRL